MFLMKEGNLVKNCKIKKYRRWWNPRSPFSRWILSLFLFHLLIDDRQAFAKRDKFSPKKEKQTRVMKACQWWKCFSFPNLQTIPLPELERRERISYLHVFIIICGCYFGRSCLSLRVEASWLKESVDSQVKDSSVIMVLFSDSKRAVFCVDLLLVRRHNADLFNGDFLCRQVPSVETNDTHTLINYPTDTCLQLSFNCIEPCLSDGDRASLIERNYFISLLATLLPWSPEPDESSQEKFIQKYVF